MPRRLASFASAEPLIAAVRDLRALGYAELETYTPYPVEALERPASHMPKVVFGAAMTGAVVGYSVQWFCNAWDYPLNVGGRPFHSPPAFVPITFETAVLFGAFSAVFFLVFSSGLPRLFDPIDATPGFVRASRDRFFLAIDLADPCFSSTESARVLTEHGAVSVHDEEAVT